MSRQFITKNLVRYRDQNGKPTCKGCMGDTGKCPALVDDDERCAFSYHTPLQRRGQYPRSLIPKYTRCIMWDSARD